jgi:hypothetical protein
MADDKKLVPDGKTIVDGIAGNSLDPDTDVVPAQGGIPGHTSDRLDTAPQQPPPRPLERRHDGAPDESSAADIVEIIEVTRDDNPTNQNAVRNRR